MIEGMCHCGAVRWHLHAVPDKATACNCTLCRRSGALWAYGHDGLDIQVVAGAGELGSYVHGDRLLALHFCRNCGNITHWRALADGADGRRRCAVNLRMAAPAAVAAIAIRRFDGLDTWEDLPQDGRCVADVWA